MRLIRQDLVGYGYGQLISQEDIICYEMLEDVLRGREMFGNIGRCSERLGYVWRGWKTLMRQVEV